MEAPARESRPIQTRLGLWDTTSIIVGIIIGVGIYATPANVFNYAPGPWWALGVWVLGGLLSLVGAFCFAELASTYPRSGGEYVYLTRAYGSPAGFLFAWAQLAVIRTGGSIAALAYLFAFYAGKLCNFDPAWRTAATAALAALAIGVLTLVNVLGVRLGKGTQNFLTVTKLGGLVVILLAGLFWANPSAPAVVEGQVVSAGQDSLTVRTPSDGAFVEQKVAPGARVTVDGKDVNDQGQPWRLADLAPGVKVKLLSSASDPDRGAVRIKASTDSLLGALAVAMMLVLWTYAGWHEAAYVAAEVENRRRNLPLALILGTGAVMVLYLLVNAAYLAGLGYESAADSPTVAADVLGLLQWGRWASADRVMAVLVMLSALGAINGMIFTSSRIYSELGADHRLFAPLAKWSRRWGTPVRSLVVQAVVSVAMVGVVGLCFKGQDGFETLVKCTSPVFCFFFLLTGAALIVLRFKDRTIERPFVTPAYPLLPLLFCAFWGFMLYGSVRYAPLEAAVGLGILLAGVPLYLLSRGWERTGPQGTFEPLKSLARDEGRQFSQC